MLDRCLALLLLLAAPFAHAQEEHSSQPVGTVIVDARVADGIGGPLQRVNVRIIDDRIAQIGRFKPRKGEQVMAGRGLVLAPGFIDIHNHSEEGLSSGAGAETQLSQGITTVILGADGFSPWPIGDWLAARRRDPAVLNIALMVGHATVRKQVMGDDYRRFASAAEVRRMAQLTEEGMNQGAIGLSSGLEYEIASYSNTDEVVAVAAAAARHGGFYMTHIRDEADKSFAALDEEIAIGERARLPIEHSHIKLGTVGVWGKAQEYIRVIEAARRHGVDFLADCYPYEAWNSTIKVIVPNKQYEDPTSVERAIADIGGAGRLTIVAFPPNRSYEQQTLEDLARAADITPVEMYIRIVREGDAARSDAIVVGRSMTEEDLKAFYQQPWVMVASDGGVGAQHPRGAGTFTRVLGVFVRERHWLTLPEAIRKMTSLPAQRLGWKDRGVIREGAFADLVLFNPDVVIDRATFEKPTELSAGIEKVFVNGTLVWTEGKPTGVRPGRVLPK